MCGRCIVPVALACALSLPGCGCGHCIGLLSGRFPLSVEGEGEGEGGKGIDSILHLVHLTGIPPLLRPTKQTNARGRKPRIKRPAATLILRLRSNDLLIVARDLSVICFLICPCFLFAFGAVLKKKIPSGVCDLFFFFFFVGLFPLAEAPGTRRLA